MKSTSRARSRTGMRLVSRLRHLEQHVEEVAGVAQLVVGQHVGASDGVAERIGRDARHLGDQPDRLQPPRVDIEDVLRVRIEGRERPHRAQEHAHRVRVVAEALEELLDVLVEHRVHRDAMRPGLQLAFARQLSEENQKRGLEEIALFGQLLDRIAAIEQDAFVAVDEGDPAAACRRVHERGIVGHHPEIVFGDLDLPEVRRADGAFGNRQLGTAYRCGYR